MSRPFNDNNNNNNPIVSNTTILNYECDTIDQLICSHCKCPFVMNQSRRYEISINPDTNTVIGLNVIHVNQCLQQRNDSEMINIYSRIILPSNQQHLRSEIPKLYNELVNILAKHNLDSKYIQAYAIQPYSIQSYILEMPLHPNIPMRYFTFDQFASLFTFVEITTYTVTPKKKESTPVNLIQLFSSIKIRLNKIFLPNMKSNCSTSCGIWIWTHQVSGTDNSFRLVLVIQPDMANLIKPYEQFISQPEKLNYQHTISTDRKTQWPTITEQVDNCLLKSSECIEDCIKIINNCDFKLNVEGDTTMCETSCVNHYSKLKYMYNCQNSIANAKDLYIIPNPTINGQLLCYHGKTADYIPIFYNNQIETEELLKTTSTNLIKQPLTNLQQLIAYYPRIPHKYNN